MVEDFLNLPEIVEYKGEFGPEIVLFLPFVEWLSLAGLLHNRVVKTYKGMATFYEGLDCKDVIEKDDEARDYVKAADRRYIPIKDEWSFDGRWSSPYLSYPDLRRRFAIPAFTRFAELRRGKPLFIIHNKYTNEFGFPEPQNYIALQQLDLLLQYLIQDFKVIYVRHGSSNRREDYVDDHNKSLKFDDRAVVMRYPEVMLFEDVMELHGRHMRLNDFKNQLFSQCYHFLSVQGGGAHHIACFSGSLLTILHKTGPELQFAYRHGFYNFASNPSPTRLICRTFPELVDAVDLHVNSQLFDGRIHIATTKAAKAQRLSPWSQAYAAGYE